jgi:ATP-binding cassette subfamily A (ABC1) protein 3
MGMISLFLQQSIQYHLQDPTISWDVLFTTMEEIKSHSPTLIEDYSITETTLEQVFLAFARAQYPQNNISTVNTRKCC